MKPWGRLACVMAVSLGTASVQAEGRYACAGLSSAVVSRDLDRLQSTLASGCDPSRYSGMNPLQSAIAFGYVDATKLLLEAGLDPNGKGIDGAPLVQSLGSGQRLADDDVLRVAQLLDLHHCTFSARTGPGVDLVTNLAPRHLPKTLAFLAQKKSLAPNLSLALKAVARGADTESIQALLEAGADPLDGVVASSPLLDAAAAGQTANVILMLARVSDKHAPKVKAAYEAAAHNGYSGTVSAFTERGAQPPVEPVVRPLCVPRALTSDEEAVYTKAIGQSPTACMFVQQCHDLVFIDCNSAADGPAYYIDTRSSTRVATCGGACMRGCTNCPPKTWDCSCNP